MFSTAIGDFNGDGTPDIAEAINRPSYVYVSLGRGDGTFHQSVRQLLLGAFTGVAADYNGDGRTDVVTLSDVTSHVHVYLARADGIFEDRVEVALSTVPTMAAAADVNGDGRPDLIVGHSDYDVTVVLGNGDGTFGAPTTLFSGMHSPVGLEVADFDRDGLADIAVISEGGGASLLLGRAGGGFANGPRRGLGWTARSVAVGDLNKDGAVEIVLARGDRVAISRGLGSGQVATPVFYETGGSASQVKIADLNGDGRLDIVVAHEHHAFASVLVGHGDGTFAPAENLAVHRCLAVGVGDFNSDGRTDLAFSSHVLLNITCRADFNCSGAVTVQDLSDFLSAWLARQSKADFDNSGDVTAADLFGFLSAWFARCS